MSDRVKRSLRRGWQNARPGWTRRVRWYESARTSEGVSIRLQFEERVVTLDDNYMPHEERERVNRFYSDDVAALRDWWRFERGESLRTLRDEGD